MGWTRRGVAGLALCVLTLTTGCGDQDVADEEASLAAQLDIALEPTGVEIPEGVAASLFGTDGGAICEDVESAGQLSGEAAAGVSHRFTLRRTDADPDRIAVADAVIRTYCPDELDVFDDYVAGIAVGSGEDD